MTLVSLTPFDLALAALLIVLLAGLSWWMRLGLGRPILIAAVRTTVQLLLVGIVLRALFAEPRPIWVGLMALVMLLAAGFEVARRQKRRLAGGWSYGIGTLSMFLSAFTVTILALTTFIGPEPWYSPQYAIPLLGMMLGNSMNGIALSVDHLTGEMSRSRAVIEARLLVGHGRLEAAAPIVRDSLRVGMIPVINAMAAAGLISLPGMMTGQILAGSPPLEAVKYQILVMFLVTSITGLGTILSVRLAARRLFDSRERLRLDRLEPPG